MPVFTFELRPRIPFDPVPHSMTETLTSSGARDARRLQSLLAEMDRIVVAFSGGVDSSVVAAAAYRAKQDAAVAVTARSPSVPAWQLDLACQIAQEIGIEHRIVDTNEVERSEYRRNDSRRCYYCKRTLYGMLREIVGRCSAASVVSGTNHDDLGDFRPGLFAGSELGVITPLADLGITKQRVRSLAKYYGLSNDRLPASPCLASRIAYGLEVTPERLRRVEEAEGYLHQIGFFECRVRVHHGELARIEVPRRRVEELVALDAGGMVTEQLVRIGFQFVSVDLRGLQRGGLNRMLVSLQPATGDRQHEVVD